MLEEAMPGEALVFNDVPGGKLKPASDMVAQNKTMQEMAEKLEKSEAGRKKLRQAIAMLKEKMEATEKVLQVNETLRQECEKERQRAEVERKKAEEEKNLRLQIEKEGLSVKEQLVRVMQRLDNVERNCKADRGEVERMRGEIKQAVAGLSGASQAIEAAHSSFQSLEKSLLSKVNNAITLSTKASSMAQNVISDGKATHGIATSAEKTCQSLSARVAALQKQGVGLDQRVNLLQQELRSRQTEPSDFGVSNNGDKGPQGMTQVAGRMVCRKGGMVLSKNQQQNGTGSNNPKSGIMPSLSAGALSPKAGHSEAVVGLTGVGVSPEIQSNEPIRIDAHRSPISVRRITRDLCTEPKLVKKVNDSAGCNSVREALNAVKQKRNLSRTTSVSSIVPTLERKESSLKSGFESRPSGSGNKLVNWSKEVDVLLARAELVDSGNGSVPTCAGGTESRVNGFNVEFPDTTASNRTNESEVCSAFGTSNVKNTLRASEESAARKKAEVNSILVESSRAELSIPKCGKDKVVKDQKKEKLSVVLLKDITKLFHKEKKAHSKMEAKLMALEKTLQLDTEMGYDKQQVPEKSDKKSSKRKRKEQGSEPGCKKKLKQNPLPECHFSVTKKTVGANGGSGYNKTLDGAVKSSSGKDTPSRKNATAASQLIPPSSVVNLKTSEATAAHQSADFPQECHVAGNVAKSATAPMDLDLHEVSLTQESAMDKSLGVDIDEKDCGENPDKGWDTDSESSEDGLDDEWWSTKRILLSPNLPEVLPPSSTDFPLFDTLRECPAPREMSLEDIALFLDVLPPLKVGASEDDTVERTIKDKECFKAENMGVGTVPLITVYPSETLEDENVDPQLLIRSLSAKEIVSSSGLNETDEFQRNGETIQGTMLVLERCTPVDADCEEVCNRTSSCNGSSLPGGKEMTMKDPGNFCGEKDDKENMVEGVPSRGCGSRPNASVLSPHEANVVATATKSAGLDSSSIRDIGVDAREEGRGSICTVKTEQYLDSESQGKDQYEDFHRLYGLDLVMEDSTDEEKLSELHRREDSCGSQVGRNVNITRTVQKTRVCLMNFLQQPSNTQLKQIFPPVAELGAMWATTNLSGVELLCIFTGSLVDVHSWWDSPLSYTCSLSNCEIRHLFVTIITEVLALDVFQQVFSIEASSVFVDTLQKFLILGSIKQKSLLEVGKGSPQGSSMKTTFHFSASASETTRLKAVMSGSTLLAVFCDEMGKLDFLRDSVYLILRFCEKDTMWLLTTTSSFAQVCGNRLFTVDRSDIVGQAVHVVISELLNDAEASRPSGCQTEHLDSLSLRLEDTCDDKVKSEQSGMDTMDLPKGKEVPRPELLSVNLSLLREVVGKEESLNFETFLPKLLGVFQSVINPSFLIKPSDFLSLFRKKTWKLPFDQIGKNEVSRGSDDNANSQDFNPCTGTGMPSTLVAKSPVQSSETQDHYCWRFGASEETNSRAMPVNEVEYGIKRGSCIKRGPWEQMFKDTNCALDLVACHLGWEWTYNDLIVEHLWKLVAPGAPPLTVGCIAHVFGTLGRLGIEDDGSALPGVEELRKSLIAVLGSDYSISDISRDYPHRSDQSMDCPYSFSFVAQVGAAQSLLELSGCFTKGEFISKEGSKCISMDDSGTQEGALNALMSWFKALKPETLEYLPSSLRSALFT